MDELGRLLAGNREIIAELKAKIQVLRVDADTKYSELLKENRLLNQLIKQYESTLEVIMAKFRVQTALQIEWSRNLDQERQENSRLRLENVRLSERLDESVNVIRMAIEADDETELAR
ncbi:hypothetical protein HK101_009895 [Irineochytrium annulatum]|nr:hypothetical protein HK101_009895 [Irineochytrium annulatum]